MSELEEAVQELQEVYARAVELRDKFFPTVSKYIKDSRITTLSLMKALIELEKLRVERRKLV